jgi:hypothetical protein
MLSIVVMLNVIVMLSLIIVMLRIDYTEWRYRYTVRRYAECRGAGGLEPNTLDYFGNCNFVAKL